MAQPHDMKILAYEIWCKCGQNLSECERILKNEHGFKVSRPTLTEWKQTYDWEGRLARSDVEKASQAEDISDGALLNALLGQKKKYEAYFENLPVDSIDNQAVYAYSNLLKKIVDIRPKGGAAVDIDRPKLFLEDMEFLAQTLKEIDPEGLKVLGRNIDTIIARFKEQYAKAA